jgi:hypothetical protein
MLIEKLNKMRAEKDAEDRGLHSHRTARRRRDHRHLDRDRTVSADVGAADATPVSPAIASRAVTRMVKARCTVPSPNQFGPRVVTCADTSQLIGLTTNFWLSSPDW